MRYIDDSHTPFKRAKKNGPGPKKRTAHWTGDLECERRKPTATHYVQVCTYVGSNRKRRGKKYKVLTAIKPKLKYMKKYREWAKKQARLAALGRKGPMASYKCRKTPVATCKKKKP